MRLCGLRLIRLLSLCSWEQRASPCLNQPHRKHSAATHHQNKSAATRPTNCQKTNPPQGPPTPLRGLLVSKKEKNKIYELIEPLGGLGGLGGNRYFFCDYFLKFGIRVSLRGDRLLGVLEIIPMPY